MLSKKMVILLVIFSLLSLLPIVFGQTHYFDYGYDYGGGFGSGEGFGFGFISNLCDNYAEWFEFFVLFVVFFVFGHWAFKGPARSKSDILAVVIAFALAIGIVRWEATSGFSLVCGLGDIFGGLFGGFLGLIFILLIIIGLFAALKGSNATRTVVGLAYLLFWFWMQSEGGYQLSGLFYYLPLSPFFVMSVLNILALVAAIFVVVFGWKWIRGTE
ncbi:MAG: hypothetical protein ABIB47_05890 [Candidatus Woesearchaeota archaeon]